MLGEELMIAYVYEFIINLLITPVDTALSPALGIWIQDQYIMVQFLGNYAVIFTVGDY